MTFLRGLLLALGIAFIASCVWAAATGHFSDEFKAVLDMAWGKISLADLVLGFIVISVIILAFEPVWIGLPIVILLFIFGNWVSAFWLALRLPKIIRKMRGVA
ncbi:hypothetical protein [Ponticaulis profundi]|uniref:DUF1475 domain-containing protein n=1 Tax=Ponticaulis profundi TaxID=2665222 RepID=A0ABW1S987_9PROT